MGSQRVPSTEEGGRVMTFLPAPLNMSQMRRSLGACLRAFREHGGSASPIVFGRRSHPEAVMLSAELYALLCALDAHLSDRSR